MYKKLLFIVLLLLNIFIVYSDNVTLDIEVLENKTLFLYEINFTDQRTKIFSIEKPQGAVLEYAINLNSSKSLEYSIAGDYFRFKPNPNEKNEKFKVLITSTQPSEKINQGGAFSSFIHFNFLAENIYVNLDFEKDFESFDEIFPRNYEEKEKGNYFWHIEDMDRETLFFVRIVNQEEISQTDFQYFIYLVIIAPLVFFFVLIMFVKKSKKTPNKSILDEIDKEEKKKEKVKENKTQKIPVTKKTPIKKKKNEEKKEIKKEEKSVEEEKIDELPEEITSIKEEKVEKKEDKKVDLFEEKISKFLTENEQEVVKVVKKNDGIIQNEILDFLNQLTKSNLSKIVAKLHSKRFLNRVKVGKVNKIFLGEQLLKENLDKEVETDKKK